MMQQPFPALILGRSAKARFVVRYRIPVYQQHITLPVLDTAQQLVTAVTVHASDNCLGLGERRLEVRHRTRLYLQVCNFKNHQPTVVAMRRMDE